MMPVVIGVGNPYRRDDAIGPRLAEEIEQLDLPWVRVVYSDGEPTGLIEAWTGVPLAIIVDAARHNPRSAGTIYRSTVDGMRPGGGTHGLGIPEAVLLGEALDRLPDRLVVLAVEAADLTLGTGLSPAVTAALPELRRFVLAELSTARCRLPAGDRDRAAGEREQVVPDRAQQQLRETAPATGTDDDQ